MLAKELFIYHLVKNDSLSFDQVLATTDVRLGSPAVSIRVVH